MPSGSIQNLKWVINCLLPPYEDEESQAIIFKSSAAAPLSVRAL